MSNAKIGSKPTNLEQLAELSRERVGLRHQTQNLLIYIEYVSSINCRKCGTYKVGCEKRDIAHRKLSRYSYW